MIIAEKAFESLDIPEVTDVRDLRQCYRAFRPFPKLRTLAWAIDNVINDQGRPYDHASYPHLGAPGGPMDAHDDIFVRTISLQFATRLGKSFFGQSVLLYYADTDPCPMLMASESKDALIRIMGRTYKMVYHRQRLKAKLLYWSRRDHKQDNIIFTESEVKGAWARSPGTLADNNIKVAFANELDKPGWEGHSTSKEAAPEKLLDDRLKDYWSVRKAIYESTPTVRGHSRIERRRLAGTNCKFYVPCPCCKRYQVLRMGGKDEKGKFDPKKPGRIDFKKTKTGKLDVELARTTAKYICIHNECEIGDDKRAWMMRRGVWCPEGCTVKDEEALKAAERWRDADNPWNGWKNAEWIEGDPAIDGPNASYQLSSLYALTLGWGDIAAEFCECVGKATHLQNFVNQWLGETWDQVERKQTWEQLGAKIINFQLERFRIPATHSLITSTIDKQQDYYVWQVNSWGPERRFATIAYGEEDSLEDCFSEVVEKYYHYEDDESRSLKTSFTLIDSGHRPKGVYEACAKWLAKGVKVLPCKGASKAMDVDYRISTLGEDTSMPGMRLVLVDTVRTQDWVDGVLHDLEEGAPGSMQLHRSSLEEHQDYLQQMLNDASQLHLDAKTNLEREIWIRINSDIPNDYRDLTRYGYIAMLIETRGKPIKERKDVEEKPKKRNAVMSTGRTRPDGRAWNQ